MATFITPLNLNKLDLKDYLYHLYKVPVLSVRSYVQQSRIRSDKAGARMPAYRRWFRPRAVKRMTVEMAPAEMEEEEEKEEARRRNMEGGGFFVWPKKLEGGELEAWDKETYDAAKKEQDVDRIARVRGVGGTVPRKDRSIIAEQARILLEGKESWRPGWKDYGLAKGPERGFQ
ncbi:hypothetical protein MMC14_002441 [Varicellaria rhodocarpa]|nr:hypothetical protein [Varicellaria rhodocarpa]